MFSVGVIRLKHRVYYVGVPTLHIVEDAAIKCPSGLLSAHFLALTHTVYLFSS